MQKYIKHMNKCIELAKLAQGKTSPNPMVGCVVLDKDDKIIATGYHKQYGEYHAERDALLKLDNAKGCTLIVNLEPCSHFGKTPPCTDLIIEKGITTVVYGMKDPNPIVSGRGIEKLRQAGIKVIGPVLEAECKKLNEVFIKNHVKQEVFVALKTATTLDGKIATYTNDSKWITSNKARNEVRNIRKKYDAILTSSSTVIADNPTMEHNCKIVLDRNLKTNPKATIYNQGKIYIFYSSKLNIEDVEKKEFLENRFILIPTPENNNQLDIKFILEKLFELGIRSILVESGGCLNGSFLPFVDKIYHFIAPKILGDNNGKSCFYGSSVEKIANCKNLTLESIEKYEPDVLLIYTSKTK